MNDAATKRRMLLLWAAAVIATACAFVAHLSLRLETVRLGYDVGQARREERRLIEERRLLSIEAATLRDPSRVETIARGSLGMEVPDTDHVVPVGQTGTRRASGRMR
jgi:cell division protein FtsL